MTALLIFSTATSEVAHSAPDLQGGSAQHTDEVLGVTVEFPAEWKVVEDRYLAPDFGFSLVNLDGRLMLRVGWLHEVATSAMNETIQQTINAYPDVSIQRENIKVDGKTATILSPVPGIEENSYIIITANDRLYQVIYGRENIDEQGRSLLNSLRFAKSGKELGSLNLLNENDTLTSTPPQNTNQDEKKPSYDWPITPSRSQGTVTPNTVTGCVDVSVSTPLFTPWSSIANGAGTCCTQGWSKAGLSFFGNGLHQGCDSTSSLNDYYAVDYPLVEWNPLYGPAQGTVLCAGWAQAGWAGLGRVVVIDAGGGYQSMSAHLRSINVSTSQSVSSSTLIGYAGGSGYNQDGYWASHIHQGFYQNSSLNCANVGVYGGKGAQPIRIHYFGNGSGDYWNITSGLAMSW